MPNWCYNEMTVTCEDDQEAMSQMEDFKRDSIVKKTHVEDDGTTREYEELTFKGVVPMPPELEITSGSSVSDGILYLKAKDGDLSGINEYIKRDWTYKDELWNNEPNESKLYEKSTPVKEKIRIAMEYLEEKLEVNDLTHARTALENIKKHGAKDWYDWSINNWGTKWDASTQDIDEMDGNWLSIRFDTAWSPPEPWLQAVTEKYPLLDIMVRVTEESDAFMGYICCRNGKMEPTFAEPHYPH